MSVKKFRTYFNKDEYVICPSCNENVSNEAENPWVDQYDFNDENGYITCNGEEYIICPICGNRVVLSTWIEVF